MGICPCRHIHTPECDEDRTCTVKITPSDSNNTYIQLDEVNTVYSIKVGPSNRNSTCKIEWELNLEEKSSLNINGYYLSAKDDYTVVPENPATDGSYFVLGLDSNQQYYYMYLPTQDTSCQAKEENQSLNENEEGREECGSGELMSFKFMEDDSVTYYLSTSGENLKYIPLKSTTTLPMTCLFSIYPPLDQFGKKKVSKKNIQKSIKIKSTQSVM